jgi:hypothetical protein
MNTTNALKVSARMAGIFFLLAMGSSLTGAILMEPLISDPDWLSQLLTNTPILYAGVYLELLNAISVIGIAVMLFRVLKEYNEHMAIGYLGFRIIESMVCIIAAILPLLLLTLGKEYAEAGGGDVSGFLSSGNLIYDGRGYISSPDSHFFSALRHLFYIM